MQKIPPRPKTMQKPITYTPKPSQPLPFNPHAISLSKHGNPPNAASRNAGTLNSDRQRVREANAMRFALERKAGRLAHQRRWSSDDQIRAA